MKHRIFNIAAIIWLCLQTIFVFAQNDVKKNTDEYLKRSEVLYQKYYREQDSLIKLRLMSVKNSGEYKDISGSGRGIEAGSAVAKGLAQVKNSRFTVDEAIDELTAYLRLLQTRFKTRIPKFVQTKDITQTYPVTQNDKLIIENRFGKIAVNIWDKNEIKIDVKITGFGDSEFIALKAIEYGDILIDKQENMIKFKLAKLLIQSNEYSGSETDYTVYMPANNAISIKNSYGDVFLSDLKGPVNSDTEYGTITTKNLSNAADDIKSKFASVNIQSMQAGKVTVSHGNLKIANAGDVQVTTEYSPVTIDNLSGNSSFNLKFGNEFKVSNINKNVKTLSIDASYLSLVLNSNPAAGFTFSITSDNAAFKYNKAKMSKHTTTISPTAMSHIYNGHYGGEPGIQLTINTKASSILFQ